MRYIYSVCCKALLFCCMALFSNPLLADCTMVCNDKVNLTLNIDCELLLLADMLLENPCGSNADFLVSIEGLPNALIPAPGTYVVTIEYAPLTDHDGNPATPDIAIPSGETCWGDIVVEDKTGPVCELEQTQFTVFCSELPVGVPPTFMDCTGLATDTSYYDEVIGSCSMEGSLDFTILNPNNGNIAELLPTYHIPFPTTTPSGFHLDHIVVRTWQISDVLGNIALPCQQYFYYWRPSVVLPPNPSIQIDCILGTNPENWTNTDPQYVPHHSNPAYGTDTNTNNDLPLTAVDDLGNTAYLPALPNQHEACKYSIIYEDQPIDGLCGNTFKYVREWRILNWCTGAYTQSEQVVKLIDTIPPVIICPADVTFYSNADACSGSVIVPLVTAEDACSDTITYTNKWFFGSGQERYDAIPVGVHPLTFVATDACGNSSTCTINVEVQDIHEPIVVCEQSTQVSISADGTASICADDIDSGSFDNCSFLHKEISLVGTDTFVQCLDFDCLDVNQTYQVLLKVTDMAGLNNQCEVDVFVVDMISPTVLCPPDFTMHCGLSAIDTTMTGVPIAIDNCPSFVKYSDIIDLNECQQGTITRNWLVADGFGNEVICTQTITLEDMTAPNVHFFGDTTLYCTEMNLDYGRPIIEDDCSLYSTGFEDLVLVDEPCFRKVLRTWTVLGECDDFVETRSLYIKINLDENSPDFENEPIDITLSCEAEIPFAEPTITDSCDEELTIEFVETQQSEDCAGGDIYTRTWMATDACGNSNVYSQMITILDTIAPVFQGVPTLIVLECDEIIPDANPIITDNCTALEDIEVIFSESEIGGTCAFQRRITRSWTATDACGNMSFFGQSIDVLDTTAPEFFNIPANLTISCDMEIPFAAPFAGDNCSTGLQITFEETEVEGDCSQERVLTRTWTTIDDCGNETTATQIIDIIDETIPLFTNQPVDITIGCTDIIPLFLPEVTDNCGTDFAILMNNDTTGTPCEWIITRTWTVIDACGNSNSIQQIVTKADNAAPTIAGILNIDTDLFVDCIYQANLPIPTATDDCSTDMDIEIFIDFNYDGVFHNLDFVRNDTTIINGSPGGTYPLGRHLLTYSVTDDCGNEMVTQSLVTVKDVRPPVSGCFNTELTLDENGETFITVDELLNLAATFDNCTDIYFEFGAQFPEQLFLGDTLFFDCDNLGINNYQIYIEDTFGNFDYCGNVLNIVDPMSHCALSPRLPIIAGKVYTENQKGIANTTIQLTAMNQNNVMTNEDGVYVFEQIAMGSTCSVQPQSPDDYLNGVSTYDLVLIQQHILGVQLLDSPYKLIAADINHSGSISTADIIALRQTILFIQPHFPNNDSWRYFDTNLVFQNVDNPFEETMREDHFCENIVESHLNLDFIAVKIGDVDNSVQVSNVQAIDNQRNSGKLELTVENTAISKVINISVGNYVDNLEGVVGIQFALEWDIDKVEQVELEYSGRFDASNFGQSLTERGVLIVSWNDTNSLSPFDNLFSLRLQTKETVSLKDVLKISSEYTTAEAYSTKGVLAELELAATDIQIEPVSLVSNILETKSNFQLLQNEPNPFSRETLIRYEAAAAIPTQLQVTDIGGRLIYSELLTPKVGWNSIRLHRNQFPEEGIYIYQLRNAQGVWSKKLLVF